jgi:hypothetical protein
LPLPGRIPAHPHQYQVGTVAGPFVDAQGLVFSNDYDGGLYIAEFEG